MEAESWQYGECAFGVAAVGFDECFVEEERSVGGVCGEVSAE